MILYKLKITNTDRNITVTLGENMDRVRVTNLLNNLKIILKDKNQPITKYEFVIERMEEE